MYFLVERHRRMLEIDRDQKPGPVVGDYLFEKDKIFAYLNLDNEELKLYERYYEMLAPALPRRTWSSIFKAKTEILRERISKKGHPDEAHISPEYLETVAQAYEHFFFHYSASNLLVVDASEIDFDERNSDLQEFLRRLRQPVKGTQYFLPLGPA